MQSPGAVRARRPGSGAKLRNGGGCAGRDLGAHPGFQGQQLLGVGHEALPGAGQDSAGREPVDQAPAQALLECLDLPGDGGLDIAQLARRGREAAGPCDGDERSSSAVSTRSAFRFPMAAV